MHVIIPGNPVWNNYTGGCTFSAGSLWWHWFRWPSEPHPCLQSSHRDGMNLSLFPYRADGLSLADFPLILLAFSRYSLCRLTRMIMMGASSLVFGHQMRRNMLMVLTQLHGVAAVLFLKSIWLPRGLCAMLSAGSLGALLPLVGLSLSLSLSLSHSYWS